MNSHRGISVRIGLLCLLAALILASVAARPAAAQVLYGSVVGTVEDQTGAVVPKATVTITNKATGLTREAAADDAGRFSLLNVLAGTYDLKVTAQGFRTSTRTDIEVSINTVTRQNVRLEVGAVSEQVTVAASAAVLQTDKSDVRHEITSQAVTNMPLPGYRNYQTLMDLLPGTTPSTFQNAIVDTPARALTTRVNGTARNMNNTLTDGAVNIFIWLPHHTAYVQPVESIETVNITTNAFDAEQGMAGGAAITVATKSGTNDIHGSGFWFHNNQRWLAGPYYRSATFRKPVDIFNQFGGTVGGPIKKDKLFYFFSFERTMYRQGGAGNWSTPPAEFRVGDFSRWPGCTVCGGAYSVVYDPASAATPAQRQPFAGNIVPRSRISPIFDAIQKLIPLPNQVSPTDPANNLGGTFGTGGTLKYNRNNYDIKGNWNASSKLAVWGKLSRMGAPVTGKHIFGDMVGPNIGTAGEGSVRLNMPTFGFTYTFSPTFIMDAVFGYTRHDQDIVGTGQGKNWGLDVFKIPGTNGGKQYANDMRYSGVPQIETGFTGWGLTETWLPLERRERSYTSPVNFSRIAGSHEIRWGFEPRRLEMNHWQPETANPRGYIGFGGGPTMVPGQTGRVVNQYATALLGLVTSYSKSIQYFLMQTREWQYAWYVRDRWQVSRRLTLNLGLRYEYYPLINRAERGIEQWNPYTNVVLLGGLGSTPRNAGITVSRKLLAPRIGFAYRVREDWVIRSGYGMTWDPLPFSRPLRGLYPSTLTGSWGAGTEGAEFRDPTYGWYNTVDKGIPDVPTPDVSKGSLVLPLNFDMGPRSPWGGELHRGYIQSWNFTVERKLPLDTVVSAGYVATRTIHQMLDRNINTVGPGLGIDTRNLPLAKLYGRTNAANMWDGIGYGTYNSLQVTANKSMSKGLFLKGAYTWGRYMNMAEDNGWAGLAMWSWEPMIARNYAPSSEDRRHSLVLGWVYEMPFGAGKRHSLSGITDTVLGGWKITGAFVTYSGTPFTVSGSGSSLQCIGCSQTADQIAPVRKIDQGRGPNMPYYDPMSFRDPLFQFNPANPVYRPGTMGRNVLYGPGYWRLNPAIYKEFQVTERVKAEFRAESTNFTNTPRWSNPSGGAGSMQLNPDGSLRNLNNFMSITGASAERQFRLGLRLAF
ncbi:MAG: TonB-dependent receptor [Acidobacteria bacterium]|nr:TonB-dependent receptor [Acidobacteriota bacterium]